MNTKKNFISQIMVTIMFAITFLITGQCFGADDGDVTRYGYREAGFSIALPQHWREISAEVLSQQQAASNTDIMLLSDFQLKTAQAYPNIKINLDTTMEISDDYLNSLPQITKEQIFSKAENNVRKYDPATHTLWQLISANQQEYGEFYSVWAMRFTKKGWIQIVMVLKAEQYPEYLQEFQQIVNSIKINKDLVGRSGLSNYDLIKRVGVGISLLAILASVLFPVMLRLKGKRSNLDSGNGINSLKEINDEMITREYKGDPEVGRKRFKILYFSLFGFVTMLIIVLSILSVFKMVGNTNYNITVFLLSIFGTLVIFWAPLTVLVYFLGLKFQEKLIDNFVIILAKDRITLKLSGFTNTTIYKNEIKDVVEGRCSIKVTSEGPKPKTIMIRKDLKGYEELKRELQGWVRGNL
jgi:hypothetical protein